MKIAIVGGGITGLTAAHELGKRGHAVTVYEQGSTLGGLAHGFTKKNWKWHLEFAYHHLFTNDLAIRSLATNLGLEKKLLFTRSLSANYYKGSIIPLDGPLHLLKFPDIPMNEKLRTGMLLAFFKFGPYIKWLETITARSFVTTIGGKKAWDILWDSLFHGKFNKYKYKVNASWFWARIKKRTPSLGYFQGGFQVLISALEKSIRKSGGSIRLNTAVSSIKRDQKGQLSIGSAQFDQVLITTPTPIAKGLLPATLEMRKYLKPLSTIPHLHAQTLILETDKPVLQNVYWLNVTDKKSPFVAMVAHTNMINKKYYGGNHITYIGNYLPLNHRYLKLSPKQLLDEFLPYIQKINPALKKKNVLRTFSFVGQFAQPVHQLNYSQKIPLINTPLPGVYLANMDFIHPWDRGTNYAVELGQSVVKEMMTK